MNRLFHFATGAISTFTISNSFTSTEISELIIKQLLSIIGGVLSAIVIARLQHRWQKNDDNPHSA